MKILHNTNNMFWDQYMESYNNDIPNVLIRKDAVFVYKNIRSLAFLCVRFHKDNQIRVSSPLYANDYKLAIVLGSKS